jgi:hypothetical protein
MWFMPLPLMNRRSFFAALCAPLSARFAPRQPVLLGTITFVNIEQAGSQYIEITIKPWLERGTWKDALSAQSVSIKSTGKQ